MALTKVSSGLISADASSVDLNIDAGTLYIDATNNHVGIGTTNPARSLHIRSTGEGSGLFLERTSNYGFVLYNEVETTTETFHLGFVNNGTFSSDILVANESGNVGIGTSSPDDLLHVFAGDSTATPHSISALNVENNGSVCISIMTPNTSVGQIRFADPQDDGKGILGYDHSVDAMVFSVNGPEKVRIDSSGNVGIGTSSPTTYSLAGTHLDVSSATASQYAFIHANTPSVKAFFASDDGSLVSALYTYSNHPLKFGTNNTERMRINNDGDIRIGISSAAITGTECYTFSNRQEGNNLALYTTGNASFYSIDMWNLVGGTCNQVLFRSGGSGTAVGSITSTGNTATQYNTSSDYRLKENIQPLANGLERLQQLKPVQFDWKSSGETSEGFIAHEVQEVFPEAVSGEKDGEDMQGMDYGRITPLLVKAIQEQQVLIEQLQAEVALLKGE